MDKSYFSINEIWYQPLTEEELVKVANFAISFLRLMGSVKRRFIAATIEAKFGDYGYRFTGRTAITNGRQLRPELFAKIKELGNGNVKFDYKTGRFNWIEGEQ